MTDVLDQIRNSLSLLKVISNVVTLKKKGQEYMGLCPFHQEKTPSFFVNEYKGFYYCFGCAAKGNIFDFYVNYYRMPFRDVVEELAKQANIDLPKNSYPHKKVNSTLFKVCEMAGEYFEQNLLSENGRKARDYLVQRGITKSFISKFNLGYASYSNPNLWKKLANHKVYDEDIFKVGLKTYNDKGEVYEFFRNRLIFPIKNASGKIVAFGGRILEGEGAKYLNSKESDVFHKKMILYGLHESLRNLKHNHLVIVEGYMDVIAMHQSNLAYAVACLGTSISKDHINNIVKYDKSPVFCLDGDIAGGASTMRVIDEFLPILEVGMDPRFVSLSFQDDPDTILQKSNGKTILQQYIIDGYSLSEILWQHHSAQVDLSIPERSAALLKNLYEITGKIKNNTLRSGFIDYFNHQIKKNKGVLPLKQLGKNFITKKSANLINHKIDAQKILTDQYTILLICIMLYPEIMNNQEVWQQLGSIAFQDKILEGLREYLIEHNGQFNNDDFIYDRSVEDVKQNIMQLQLVQPLLPIIKSSDDALHHFNLTSASIKIKEFYAQREKIELNLHDLIKSIKADPLQSTDATKLTINKLLREKIAIQKHIDSIVNTLK